MTKIPIGRCHVMYYVSRTVLVAIQMLAINIINNISSSISTIIVIMVPSRWSVRKSREEVVL